jgi:RsiG-like
VDSFPDLATLSDQELKDLIHDLERQENEVSYRRRILHGQIDILHAELVARLRGRVDAGESPISEADVSRLAEILAAKGAPRIEADVD